MSIYSDLLTTAVGADELRWRASPGELLATCWSGVPGSKRPTSGHPVASIAMCRSHSITTWRCSTLDVPWYRGRTEQFAQPMWAREARPPARFCGPRPRGRRACRRGAGGVTAAPPGSAVVARPALRQSRGVDGARSVAASLAWPAVRDVVLHRLFRQEHLGGDLAIRAPSR